MESSTVAVHAKLRPTGLPPPQLPSHHRQAVGILFPLLSASGNKAPNQRRKVLGAVASVAAPLRLYSTQFGSAPINDILLATTCSNKQPVNITTNESPSLKRPPRPKPPAHTTTAEQLDVIQSMEGWVTDELLPRYANRVEFNWQPSDLLPESSDADFLERVRELRARSAGLPDDFWVCLAGNAVSEEGLPNSHIMVNTLDGTRDVSGADATPWARWTRAWAGEESRHGKVLHQYLYLTGQVNMHALDKTAQYLINSGMDPKTENNPYLGFVYATFVERATFLSHRVLANRAQELGDPHLGKICGTVAGDEKRHELAYGSIVSKLMEVDANGTVRAFADMMRKQMVMPAHLMKDGQSPTLFRDYSEVAQRCGVYTSFDYADIVDHLISLWGISDQKGLSAEGLAAQEYLCKLPSRVRRLAERTASKLKKGPARLGRFSWVFNKEVPLL